MPQHPDAGASLRATPAINGRAALVERIFEAVKQFVGMKIARIDTRLAEIDTRLAAIEGLHAEMKKLEGLLDPEGGGAHYRLERHAQHLARLENRIQKLERK